MNRKKISRIHQLRVLLLMAGLWSGSLHSNTVFALQEGSSQQNRRVSYSIIVSNTGPDVITTATVKVFAPNKESAWQKCLGIESNHPFSVEQDALNNQGIIYSFTNLPPYGSKIINIDVKMMTGKNSLDRPHEETEQYLLDGPLLNISHQELRKKATQLAADNSLETVRKIYHWVSGTLSKTGYTKKARGALYALQKNAGDCTEFMHLFVALCRINHLPARGISGYLFTNDKRLSPSGFHDWAEVYMDGAWHLVDPFYQVFMDKENQYLVMGIHGPQQDAAPFSRWQSSNPNLQVSMTE